MNSSALKLIFNGVGLGLALVLALGLSLSQKGAVEDGLYRHLATGRAIAAQGNLPKTDEFSFSQGPDLPFNREGWALSLAAFQIERLGGLKALALTRAAALFLCFAFLVAGGFRRQARPFSSCVFALAALALVSRGASSPQAPGLALFAACLYLMEGPFWASFFGRWVWLPLLGALWVNLDAGALIVLPLAWIWAFSDKAGPDEQAPEFPLVSRLSVLGLLSASLFLHPALWRLPFTGLDWSFSSPFSAENFMQSQGMLAMLALAFLLLVASSWLPGGKRHLGRDAWLFVFLGLGGLVWKAMLPYAAIWAAPLMAARADSLVDALPGPLKTGRWLLKAGLLGLGVWSLPPLLAGAARGTAPAPRVQTFGFFKEQLLDGALFTESNFAGRALWELSPSARVFAHDGMVPTARKKAEFEQARVLAAEPAVSDSAGPAAWEKILQRSQADFALLRLNSPLAKVMARSAAWQPVDFDDRSVLYARVEEGHAALIKTFAPRGLLPGDLDEPFGDPLFAASRLPQVEADLESRLVQHPDSGVLCYFEAMLWKQKDKPMLARQWLEKGVRADPDFAPNYRLLAALRLQAGDKEAAQAFLERAAALEAQ